MNLRYLMLGGLALGSIGYGVKKLYDEAQEENMDKSISDEPTIVQDDKEKDEDISFIENFYDDLNDMISEAKEISQKKLDGLDTYFDYSTKIKFYEEIDLTTLDYKQYRQIRRYMEIFSYIYRNAAAYVEERLILAKKYPDEKRWKDELVRVHNALLKTFTSKTFERTKISEEKQNAFKELTIWKGTDWISYKEIKTLNILQSTLYRYLQNCKDIKVEKKMTKPAALYNFDTLLSFMENPRKTEENKKLLSLGTPATRAEIVKSLITRNYITEKKNNLVVQEKGLFLIKQIQKNKNLHSLLNAEETTKWEEEMLNNPTNFFNSIKEFIKTVCETGNINVEEFKESKDDLGKCPCCGKDVYEGKKNYYCSGYSNGCKFVIWKNIANANITKDDVKRLLTGKKTNSKKCKSKNDKEFRCKFILENNEIKFVFDNNKRGLK